MNRCDIIQDLIPLYVDKQASAASCKLIEKHAADCDACKTLLAQMGAPLEQEPTDEIWLYQKALERRKRIRRILVVVVCVLLLVCWWLYMETHYTLNEWKVVSTDGKQIVAEMPHLAFFEGEIELAEKVCTMPQFQDPNVTWESVSDELGIYFPDNAKVLSVIAESDSIIFRYDIDSVRVTVYYCDYHADGVLDRIIKFVRPETDENISYCLDYDCKLKLASYEKAEEHHVWFAFLSMDW